MGRLARIAAFPLLLCGCSNSSLAPDWADSSVFPFPQGRPTPTPFLPGALPTDTGDGHSGSLSLSTGTTGINTCLPVSSASGSVVSVSAIIPVGVLVGDRVLVWQVQDAFATVGDSGDVTAPGGAGLFELARISSLDTMTITVETSLANGYSSSLLRKAQVCTVPEFTNMNVGASAVLAGAPWDGATGGLVALFVSDTFNVAGSVSVDGLGFRGGPESSGGGQDVILLETNNSNGGGKAEGLDPSGLGKFGRGNYANGAGGGNARNGGGGGGGAAGAGGFGGRQDQVKGVLEDTKGMPGAHVATAVTYSNFRFSMGGGGGGGHARDGLQADGGAGGGLILVFVDNLSGSGSLSANGNAGTGNTRNGGGGGGAGGMIVVRAASGGVTGTTSARGGIGGSLSDVDVCGPGGGGGGGWIISSPVLLLGANVSAGIGGANGNGIANGAEAGDAGITAVLP